MTETQTYKTHSFVPVIHRLIWKKSIQNNCWKIHCNPNVLPSSSTRGYSILTLAGGNPPIHPSIHMSSLSPLLLSFSSSFHPPTDSPIHSANTYRPSIYFTSHRIQITQDPAEEPNDTLRQSSMQTSRVLVVRGFRSAGQESIVAWRLERLFGGEKTEAKP